MSFDELCERIMTAQEELLKHEIIANTVILNGKKYGKLLNGKYKPSIIGMAVEADDLPDEFDFVVQYVEPRPMTNADRMRTMTDEELADFHGEYTCPPNYNWSGGCERNRDEYCDKCWLDWLKQEIENDN